MEIYVPFIRHNKLHDLMTGWLQEVCHNFTIESPLMPLTGESITSSSANRRDNAELIYMQGVFEEGDRVHF